MAKLINDELMKVVESQGTLIGSTTPGRDTKWSYFEVYYYGGKLFAVVNDEESGAICAEEISESELSGYTEDTNDAKIKLDLAKLKDGKLGD